METLNAPLTAFLISFSPAVDYGLPPQEPKKIPSETDEGEMEIDEEKLKPSEDMETGLAGACRKGIVVRKECELDELVEPKIWQIPS